MIKIFERTPVYFSPHRSNISAIVTVIDLKDNRHRTHAKVTTLNLSNSTYIITKSNGHIITYPAERFRVEINHHD